MAFKALGILIILSTGFGFSAMAATAKNRPEKSPFRVVISVSGSSNLYRQSSPDHEASTELFMSPSYSFTDKTSISLKSIVTKEMTQAKNTTLSHTTVALKTKGPLLFAGISSSGQMSGVLPTDEEARLSDRFQGGLGLGGTLRWVWKKLASTYSLSGTRNFHEYTVNSGGSPNIQYGLSQGLGFEIEINPQWAFSTSGFYRQAWTYKNFERHSYGFEAEMSYGMSKAWSLSAGFSNTGPAFKANGTESNIKVFDENTSVIRAGVTFVN